MNKDTISLTVPMDYNALTRASDMLHGMAVDLEKSGCIGCNDNNLDKDTSHIEKTIPVSEGGTKLDDDSSTNSEKSIYTSPGTIDEQIEKNKPAAPATSETPASPAAPATTAAPVGVELDSDGLPHDSRIHSRNKTKLAKTQQWKKARGVDPQLVLTVEAELRQAMAAPAATSETETPAAPAIVETPAAPAAIVETPASPAAPAIIETTGSITTFPELMAKVTAAMGEGTHTTESINAICNKHGLASLPLVSARPDIMPAIVAELFPNG